jgi:hypothetical protein
MVQQYRDTEVAKLSEPVVASFNQVAVLVKLAIVAARQFQCLR